ncbi:hypothetical protein FHK02_845 [Spirosoma sp. LMG 31448]|uniref:Uncharacterized protein n=1 Tax=Spirosoma utsteinense TaxID=2585773 RepID=A0ABR6W2G9_9BACT|nr:hypothetical protein [Spirosoma utsteinense]MBC3790779.1 hypothetical protein [Spirosoma utsteinense]
MGEIFHTPHCGTKRYYRQTFFFIKPNILFYSSLLLKSTGAVWDRKGWLVFCLLDT